MATKPKLLTDIYSVIKTNKAYEIAKDFGWVDGGCWMLAIALKPLIPGSWAISVRRSDENQIEHVALTTKDGWVIDGTGVKTYKKWVDYWENDEVDGLGDVVVEPFDLKGEGFSSSGEAWIDIDPYRDRASTLRQYVKSKLDEKRRREITRLTPRDSKRVSDRMSDTGLSSTRQ